MNLAKRELRTSRRSGLLLTALAVLITLSGIAYWVLHNSAAKQTQSSFVTGIKEVASLATAEAYVMTVLEGEDNRLLGQDIPLKLPGTTREYFMVVPAKITAGVDLKNVTEKDISVDASSKTVTVVLPKAAIMEQSVQLDAVKIYTKEGFFRGPTTAKEGMAFLSSDQVKEKLRQEAVKAGLLQTAEQNATKVIQTLVKGFGYQIDVKFK